MIGKAVEREDGNNNRAVENEVSTKEFSFGNLKEYSASALNMTDSKKLMIGRKLCFSVGLIN
jgi:hypothetical protein